MSKKRPLHCCDTSPKKRRRPSDFADVKSNRLTSFHKRKEGLFKKAHDLMRLTACEIMIFIVSETGQVYTFSSKKFEPLVTSKSGLELFESCLNASEDEMNQSNDTSKV